MTTASTDTSPAFWVTGPSRGEIAPAPVAGDGDGAPEVEVTTLYSAVSRGTESLVFHNRIPQTEYQRMRAPFQAGEFPFPVRYGYINVGEVTAGPDSLLGQVVFCLFPHQQRYRVPASAVTPLPAGLPPERAVLAANMETAINALWDGAPRIGERIAVIGCGVVGALVAWLATGIAGTEVTAVDTNPERRALMQALGVNFATTLERDDHDLVFHASGHPAGLGHALSLAGQDARIIELSWYGSQEVAMPLGEAFHSRRLTLRASQVGGLPPAQLPRWDFARRMALALSLLQDERLDALISGDSDFADLPAVMARLADGGGALCHRIVYPHARQRRA